MSKNRPDQNRSQRAAAIRAKQARGERVRKLAVGAIVVGIVAVIVVVGVYLGRAGGNRSVDEADLPTLRATETSLLMGEDAAPVKVTIYEDFLCPYCRELEMEIRKFLPDDARAGKVQVEFQPIPLLQGDFSRLALQAWGAVLTQGTPQEAYLLHNTFYDKQPYETAAVTPDQILKWAKSSGIDTTPARKAINNDETDFLEAAAATTEEKEIRGTPTVFVNGTEVQGSSIIDVARRIKEAVQAGN